MRRISVLRIFIIFLLIVALVTPLISKDTLKITGDRSGKVYIINTATGGIIKEISMGQGVVRGTFLLQNETVAVASQINKSVFWNLKTGESIRTINEQIYAFTTDEKAFITFVVDSTDRKLLLRKTDTGQLLAKLYETEFGGPYKMQISPNNKFLAVEFGSAFPLKDEFYPFPEGVLHSRYWVELFDLEKGALIKEFQEHPSDILGQFDESGRYYYLRNPDILVGGKPYDEGYRFDTQQGKWEYLYPSKQGMISLPKYNIQAEINGTVQTIAQVEIEYYDKYQGTEILSDGRLVERVGCEIKVKFTPSRNAPSCCLEYWSFVAETNWPPIGTSKCPGTMKVPFCDPPNGGLSYLPCDEHPRYNQITWGQYKFYDRPSMPNSYNSGKILLETSIGIEGGAFGARTYTIPGNSSAFQWGYEWNLATKTVNTLPMQMSTISTLDRPKALTNSCFTGWTVKVQTPKNPGADIFSPTTTNTANAGDYKNPKKIKIEFRAGPTFNKDENIPGLTASNFIVKIGGKDAKVASAINRLYYYVLEVMPPGEKEGIPGEGLYDLEVTCNITSGTSYIGDVYKDKEEKSVLYSQGQFADIVLIIDRSGSMGSSMYIQPAKNSASQFVSLINTGDKVGVVSFNENSSLNFPLTTITSTATIAAAQNAIANISSNGTTSIGIGMQLAQNQLNQNGDNSHSWALILLSDGYENTSPYVSGVIGGIPAKTNIYTIALGTDSDEALLQSIASHGGQYYMAPNTSRLLEIYNMIRGKVAGQSTVASVTGQVNQNSTKSTSVAIDNTIKKATFSLGWSGTGLQLTLKKPNGTVIDTNFAASDTLIDYTSGATFSFYTVTSPEVGNWSINVTDIHNAYTPVTYTATVNAETDLTIDPQFYADTYEIGQPITILMSLSEGGTPLKGADITVLAYPPSFGLSKWGQAGGDLMPLTTLRTTSVVDTLTLFDDGIHGDGIADDGVYGNFYLNVNVTGSHVFKFEVTGKTLNGSKFSRISERSIFIKYPSGSGLISGIISYNGTQKGAIYARAWLNNILRTGIPDYLFTADHIFGTDYIYGFGNLPEGNYTIDAFLDSDGDVGYDPSEPYGAADSVYTVFGYTIVDTADIVLQEPLQRVEVSPNPFVPSRGHTLIYFFGSSLPFSEIKIYNKAGRLVKELKENAGNDRLEWNGYGEDGNSLASGVYIWVAVPPGRDSQKGLFSIIR